jgi:hypothetical protein
MICAVLGICILSCVGVRYLETGTSFIDRGQVSRFRVKTETEFSPRNVIMSRHLISVFMDHRHRRLDRSFSYIMAYVLTSYFKNSIFFISAGYTRCGTLPLGILYRNDVLLWLDQTLASSPASCS